MRGFTRSGGVIFAGLLFCGIAVPALCLSPAPRHIVLSEKSELKISWRAMINRAPARFRLYRIDRSGSELLIEQTAHGLGLESFQYIDREEIGGESICFHLCLINANGTETVLGVIDCIQAAFEQGHNAGISTGGMTAALLPAEMAEIHLCRRRFKAYRGKSAMDFLPRPLVPPPRRLA